MKFMKIGHLRNKEEGLSRIVHPVYFPPIPFVADPPLGSRENLCAVASFLPYSVVFWLDSGLKTKISFKLWLVCIIYRLHPNKIAPNEILVILFFTSHKNQLFVTRFQTAGVEVCIKSVNIPETSDSVVGLS